MGRIGESGRGLWRSRWAAVGAAVAVTMGAGGVISLAAASTPASSYVAITPVRVVDTRTDIGLTDPLSSATPKTSRSPAPSPPPPDYNSSSPPAPPPSR